jgi:hypothetical protein
MVVGPASKRPVIFPARVGDRQIIDTRDSASHQPVLVELQFSLPQLRNQLLQSS